MSNNSSDDDPADDEIGYGKPPVHSRFKKGQSGNPSGKKKGTIDLKQTFEEIFSEEYKIIEAGTEKKLSGTHLVVKRLFGCGKRERTLSTPFTRISEQVQQL